jgi:hypothetical protein
LYRQAEAKLLSDAAASGIDPDSKNAHSMYNNTRNSTLSQPNGKRLAGAGAGGDGAHVDGIVHSTKFRSTSVQAFPKDRYPGTGLLKAIKARMEILNEEMECRLKINQDNSHSRNKIQAPIRLDEVSSISSIKAVMIKDLDGRLHKFDVDSSDDVRYLRMQIEHRRMSVKDAKIENKAASKSAKEDGNLDTSKTKTRNRQTFKQDGDVVLPNTTLFYLMLPNGVIAAEDTLLNDLDLILRSDIEIEELFSANLSDSVLDPILKETTLQAQRSICNKTLHPKSFFGS